MTNPDTAPEAVERLANRLGGTPLYDGGGEESDLPDNAAATLRALSAALKAAEARERDANARAMQHLRLADAAVDAFERQRHPIQRLRAAAGMGSTMPTSAVFRHTGEIEDIRARAILARHQKQADT